MTRREMVPKVLEELVGVERVDGAWIGAPDESGLFRIEAAVGEGMAAYLSGTTVSADPESPFGQGPAGISWRSGRVVISDDWRADPMMRAWWTLEPRWRASAAVPVRGRLGQRSLLSVYSETPGVFSSGVRRALLEHLSTVLGLACEHADLVETERAQKLRLERLQRLYKALFTRGEVIVKAQREHEILYKTCHRLVDSGLFATAWIGRPDAQHIQCLAASGVGARELLRLALPLQQDQHVPLVSRAWRKGRLQSLGDLFRDARLAPWHPIYARHGWRSAAAIPFRRNGQRHGILTVLSAEADFFDEEVRTLLVSLAQLLEHGLDELDLKLRLEEERALQSWHARHDFLTQLPNRIALWETLPQILARAERQGTLVAVAMLDLDGFKDVNDRYGHTAGDSVLRQVARTLVANVRETDFVARLGGDEFLLVLEGVAARQDVETVLNRIAAALKHPLLLPDGEEIVLGLSAGLTLYPDDPGPIDAFIRHADHALYAAKTKKAHRSRPWEYYTALER